MHGQPIIKIHSMTFAQRRNRLTTHFSERIPVVKRRTSVYMSVPFVTPFDGPPCYSMINVPIPLYRDLVFETIKASVYR